MSIDLHIHSINSDGTEEIETILESAFELQLEAICISDHEYLTKVPKHDDIEVINGAEISVSWKILDDSNKYGGTHLLVYFLEEDSPLNKKLQELRLNKIERNYSILKNLKEFENSDEFYIFHAATKIQDNKVLANGGRVLSIVSSKDSYAECRKEIFEVAEKIDWEFKYYRKDIGANY